MLKWDDAVIYGSFNNEENRRIITSSVVWIEVTAAFACWYQGDNATLGAWENTIASQQQES
jgi:hypothetical protein